MFDPGSSQQHLGGWSKARRGPPLPQWRSFRVAGAKSTLGISTGHRVAWRRFRVAGAAVLAGVRARRMADGLGNIEEDGTESDESS